MALTDFQCELLRLLAQNRIDNPESYVAGGLALNHRLGTPRLSRDIDTFHDSKAAMRRSWEKELQPLPYLLSAACGKAPGFSPTSMLEYVARRHYNQVEIDAKISPAGVYNAAELCRYWHEMVDRTRDDLVEFPRSEAGKAVLDQNGHPFRGDASALKEALAAGEVVFHEGTIGGAWPTIIDR